MSRTKKSIIACIILAFIVSIPFFALADENVPTIKVSALNAVSGEGTGSPEAGETINIKTEYGNLFEGEEYEIVLTATNKKTGASINDSKGEPLDMTQKFAPSKHIEVAEEDLENEDSASETEGNVETQDVQNETSTDDPVTEPISKGSFDGIEGDSDKEVVVDGETGEDIPAEVANEPARINGEIIIPVSINSDSFAGETLEFTATIKKDGKEVISGKSDYNYEGEEPDEAIEENSADGESNGEDVPFDYDRIDANRTSDKYTKSPLPYEVGIDESNDIEDEDEDVQEPGKKAVKSKSKVDNGSIQTAKPVKTGDSSKVVIYLIIFLVASSILISFKFVRKIRK